MTAAAHGPLETNPRLLRFAALILLVLVFPVVLAALGTAAGLLQLPYELWLVDQRLPVLFRVHMATAGLALLLVPCAIACHGLSLHKIVGRTAAALVLAGGVTALPVALASGGHWLARVGFLTQGVVWIALVLAAVRAIRQADRVRHMWLMLAVAALASGALWLRLASWTAVNWGGSFEAMYAVASWLSWMLPLGVVALLARYPRSPSRVADQTADGGAKVDGVLAATRPGVTI